MRWILAILLTMIGCGAQADDLIVVRLSSGQHVAVKMSAGNVTVLGLFDTMTVIGSTPTPPAPAPDEPTGPGQLICVRPWSCSLDESEADLTIRESLDAAKSQVPYLRLLPGTTDERMQLHPAERYRQLAGDGKARVFHVVPTATTPRILNQGPLDADAVLGWVKVPKVAMAGGDAPNEAQWLDVEFSKQQGELLGSIELPEAFKAQALAAASNVRTLPGFRPIPRAEWPQWVARFPVTRLAKSIRNITEQTMGSCVGHSIANCVEAGEYTMAGDLFFRRISGMSMYVRIGRSPNSGAYIPDAADEIFARGILPVTGQPYPHTFAQDTGFSTKLPSGWENTARFWKAAVYSVDDEEAAFRIRMDCRIADQFGRSSHALRGLCVTASGKWAYENSWGTDWGDLGKSIGYDSRFYSGFVYQPVLRDEIPVLLARELPAASTVHATKLDDAAAEFSKKIREIMEKAKAQE
ncbi:MAG: hypothetical protein MUE50_03940 [Pirellulaceae bacterium]|jgi:hypothetical protein|nr:hypothetical protein [Pirellulaceae bacterium]